MDVNIYLSFDGRCAEAFDFYARVLGGTLEAKHTWGETPKPDMPAEQRGQIMHASSVGDRSSWAPTRRPHGTPSPRASRFRSTSTTSRRGGGSSTRWPRAAR